jgi:hypothetical protein
MDLSKADGKGVAKIVSIEPSPSYTKIIYEGPVDGYGTVYVSQTYCAAHNSKNAGTMEGEANVIMEDGTLVSSPLRGTFYRNGKKLKVFFTDAVSNGDYNFVTWDVDLITKSAEINYYRLLTASI